VQLLFSAVVRLQLGTICRLSNTMLNVPPGCCHNLGVLIILPGGIAIQCSIVPRRVFEVVRFSLQHTGIVSGKVLKDLTKQNAWHH